MNFELEEKSPGIFALSFRDSGLEYEITYYTEKTKEHFVVDVYDPEQNVFLDPRILCREVLDFLIKIKPVWFTKPGQNMSYSEEGAPRLVEIGRYEEQV